MRLLRQPVEPVHPVGDELLKVGEVGPERSPGVSSSPNQAWGACKAESARSSRLAWANVVASMRVTCSASQKYSASVKYRVTWQGGREAPCPSLVAGAPCL